MGNDSSRSDRGNDSKKPKQGIGLAQCEGCFKVMRKDKLFEHWKECEDHRALRIKRHGQIDKEKSDRTSIDPKRSRVKMCTACEEYPAMSNSDVCYQCNRE